MKIAAYANTGDTGAAYVARIYLGVQIVDKKPRADWLPVIFEGPTEEAAVAAAQKHWDDGLAKEAARIEGEARRAAARLAAKSAPALSHSSDGEG